MYPDIDNYYYRSRLPFNNDRLLDENVALSNKQRTLKEKLHPWFHQPSVRIHLVYLRDFGTRDYLRP